MAVVVLGAMLALLAPFASTPAEAHANLRSSEPPNGAVVQSPPDSVILRFTEAPEPKLALIRVLDSGGTSYERGKPEAVPGDELALRQRVAQLPQGVYTVAWRVVSRTDGHATAGAFAFGVGVSPGDVQPSTGVVPKSPPPSAAEIASRWVFIWGLVALLGAVVTGLLAFGDPPPFLIRMMWAGAATVAVGLAGLALAQRAESGVGLGTFLGTNVGGGILWRTAALAASVIALGAARFASGRARRIAVALAGAGAVATMYAEVAAGHAAAARSLRLLEVGSQWIHFVAVGVWIGGLAALLAGIRGESDATKAGAVRRFSTTAGFALAAVAITGGIRALDEVGSWSALFGTNYGWVVLAKVGLLLVLVGLGATNRYRHVPEADRSLRGLRRVSRVEIAVATVTLAATAVLTGLSPPRGSTAQAATGPPAGIVVAGSDFATTTRIRLQVTPGYAGVNTFVAAITDFDSGQPIRASRVALRFSPLDESGVGQSTLELAPSQSAGEYRATGPNLSLDGRWLVDVLVQRATNSVDAQLQLATRCRVRALAAPGQPTIYTADLTGRATVQGYLDPGVAGLNEIHFTFFDASGNELPIPQLPTVTASRGADAPVSTEVRRFSPGHFISDSQLAAGRWRFQVIAPAGGDTTYRACFEETVRPS